eukprot:Polyplicarium_translucidae@DN3189_c0_g2_i2.p1
MNGARAAAVHVVRGNPHSIFHRMHNHEPVQRRKPFGRSRLSLRNCGTWEDLQARRVTVEWSDLRYALTRKEGKEQKVILRSIAGSAKPGRTLAVMGPSGSGKTSLLNVLSLRSTVGVSGSIEMNGAPAIRGARKIMGYVMQKDIFFSHLTVHETLYFTALLRLGRNMTFREKMRRVDEVIELLGLEKCRNTRVGTTQNRGISGGELKRLNVGNELLSTPQLFFLDEPTSGLDSSNALNLVENIVEFAHVSGITVVMSIHQPASQIFHRFDDLLLMMNGNVVYDGPAGTVGDYFAAMGHHCPPGFNVADFFMDLLSDESLEEELLYAYGRCARGGGHERLPTCRSRAGDSASPEELRSGSRRSYASGLKPVSPQRARTGVSMTTSQTEMSKTATDFLSAASEAPSMRPTPMKDLVAEAAANAQSRWLQIMVLMARSLKADARGIVTWVDVAHTAALAAVAGSMWWQAFTRYTERDLRNRVGALYYLAAHWMFVPAFGALSSFPPERDVIAKERSSKSFRIGSYFLAKTMSDFPATLIMPTAYLAVFYPMVGMEWEARVVFGTFAALLLHVEVAQSLGSLISCTAPSFDTGALTASILMTLLAVVGGFCVDLESMPRWLAWLRYVSFYHYSTNAFLGISVGGKEFQCDERNLPICTFASCTFPECPITIEGIMSHYNKDLNFWQSYLVMIGFYLFFRGWLYLGLRFGKHLKVR